MSGVTRNELTVFDKEMIDTILNNLTFKQQVAVSVLKQGWVSDKQREVLAGTFKRKQTVRSGWSPDYDYGRYEDYDDYDNYGDVW